MNLTPQAQLSIQWTIRILTREKVLLTKSDREGRENVCAPFYQLSCDENLFILIKPYQFINNRKLEEGRKMRERKVN